MPQISSLLDAAADMDDMEDLEVMGERYKAAEKQLLMELVELAAIAGLPDYYDEYCALLHARHGADGSVWRLH